MKHLLILCLLLSGCDTVHVVDKHMTVYTHIGAFTDPSMTQFVFDGKPLYGAQDHSWANGLGRDAVQGGFNVAAANTFGSNLKPDTTNVRGGDAAGGNASGGNSSAAGGNASGGAGGNARSSGGAGGSITATPRRRGVCE